ncbi:hypothetical protein BKA56DRAFT_604393 [Ilyonectria sp. MPI-CAGE-AT-0026]|nr:hypothetical protein BKA56DRAFT_604393 [Ilyonectria sp. MPI-CAGE-AT-0026]
MASTRYQPIQANCAIIWGQGDYDIEIETDDWVVYQGFVRKDFGTEFGPVLTGTLPCNSSDHAYRVLDRMLSVWAGQRQNSSE